MVAGSVRRGATAAAGGHLLDGFRRESSVVQVEQALSLPFPPSGQDYVKGQLRLRRCLSSTQVIKFSLQESLSSREVHICAYNFTKERGAYSLLPSLWLPPSIIQQQLMQKKFLITSFN